MSGEPHQIMKDLEKYLATEINDNDPPSTVKRQKNYNNTLVDVVANLLQYQYVINEYEEKDQKDYGLQQRALEWDASIQENLQTLCIIIR